MIRRLLQATMIRYLMVASVGAVVDITLFATLVYGAEIHYLWAGVAGFLLATLVNYLLSIRFVFRSGGRFPRAVEAGIIYAVSATGLLWHQLILYAAVEHANAHVMIAKFVALGLVFGWNYLLRRHFIFARRSAEGGLR
jgi:putative flippase GtrA